MKQRFLSVITIGFLLLSCTTNILSMAIAEEGLEQGLKEGIEASLTEAMEQAGIASEEAAEKVAEASAQMASEMSEKAASMLEGLEGAELEQAQSAIKGSMMASLKAEMEGMEGSLTENLTKLSEGEESAFSSIGTKLGDDFMAQTPEEFTAALEKAGMATEEVTELTSKFTTAQEALEGEVGGAEKGLEGTGLEAAGSGEEGGIKNLSDANKEAIKSMRKTLSENDAQITKLNKVSSAAESAVEKANKAAEGLAQDMATVDQLAGEDAAKSDEAFEEAMSKSKKTVFKGKSLQGMSENAVSKFNKMSEEEQASVLERSGMSKDEFEQALQGKGGREGFKKALLSVGVEDAMGSAMKDVEAAAEGAGNEAASSAVKSLRTTLEDAFGSGMEKGEGSLLEGSAEGFSSAVEGAESEVSKAVTSATEDLSEQSSKLVKDIGEKGGYDWVTKVSRKFATTSEAMSSKFESMSESLEESGVKGGAKKVGEYGVKGVKGIGKFLGGVGHTLFQAVLFMIPNIFESAFLAQKQRNALLKTYAAPIRFGNVVLQMPDSVFNMDEPQDSKFIYYGIPVDSVGAAVSSEAAAKYPGVTGPDVNNKVSAGIHDGLAKMINPVSLVSGSSGSGVPKRYNLSEQALRELPIYVSYTDKSWGKWGQVAVSDPQFTDMMINLNTGYVFFADGQSDQTPEAPLTGHGKTMSVESFLSHKMGELQTTGNQYHFTEYVDMTESSHNEDINPVIVDQFDCSCLDSGSKSDLSDLNGRCKTDKGAPTCMLAKTLNQMSAGISIDSLGRQLLTSQQPSKSSSTTSSSSTTTSTAAPSTTTTTAAAAYRAAMLGKLSDAPSLASSASSGSTAATTNAESDAVILTANSYDIAEKSLIDKVISVDVIKQKLAGTFDTTPGTLLEEVSMGALGPVLPIQGYGDQFEEYLDNFPGGASMALANPGAFTVSLSSGGLSLGGSSTSSSATSSAETISGAPAANYAAQGIYVYQCANSHFARMLKQQSHKAKQLNAADIAATYYIHDYIVFFDENLNQVPLTVSVENKDDYYFCDLRLNPEIKYYVSLIGAELPQMQVHPWDEVEAKIERVATSYRAAKTTSDGNVYKTLLLQLISQRKKIAAMSVPRSFVPLYSLETDIFGMPKISYNQGTGTKVQSIITALKQHPQLGQQFVDVKNALHNLFYQGPFGPQELIAVPKDMQATVQSIDLVFYENFNAYPIPKTAVAKDSKGQDDATLYNDILLPIKDVRKLDGSVESQTAVLPEAVDQYRGLVTDIVYTVQSDGSIKASDFSNSPFSVTTDGSETVWHLDSSKENSYYWMDFIEKRGGDSFTLPTALSTAVQQRRTAWIDFINTAMKSKFSKEELSGIEWSDTGMTLQIVGQEALSKGLYLYSCSPSPSSLAKDYFVLTDSTSPSPSSSKLGKTSALNATDDYNLLSVVSGQLYDSFGDPVQDSEGNNVVVDASTLLQTLQVQADVSASVYTTISKEQAKLAKKANKPVYPVSEFGAMQLGMYHADIVSGTYVYFDASGMTPGADPTDYFVTVDMSANPVKWQEEVSASTQNMMSLISGKVIERGREVKTHLASDKIDSVISALSQKWRASLTQKIQALRAGAKAEAAAQQAEQDKIDEAESNLTKGSLSWTSSEVMNYIANIKSAPYLAAPHGSLKQDPASKQYILVSPASSDGSAFLYTFFNVPNTYKDAQGNPIQAAVMYDDKATVMRVIEGVQLTALRNQYGVSVDSGGTQKLGATNLQPPMVMAEEDVALKAGDSGVTMLCSTSDSFPSKGIKSPVTNNGAKYYFYYNTVMRAYYVREVKTGVDRYISMAGGNMYSIDGSCEVANHPVAFNSDKADDLLLPYLNADSYTQCYMANPSNSSKFMNFVNLESEFKGNLKFKSSNTLAALNVVIAEASPCNTVNVVQMPRPATIPPMPALDVATQYNVYWDNASPTVYKVKADYSWQDLMFLPVNMSTGQALTAMPSTEYQHLKIVLNKGALEYVLFNGLLYKLAQKASQGSYELSPVGSSDAANITVSMKQDPNTKVNYVEVASGAQKYNYQYLFDALDAEQLESYRENIWKADTVADVNARILLAKDLPLSNGAVSLLPVSLKSVINLPSTQSEQAVFSANLGRIMYDDVNKRYLGTIYKSGGSSSQGPFYQYFDEDGYVDLETGILFDSNGVPALYTLHLNDLLALLDKLSVAVIRTGSGVQLSYRTASAIKTEEAALQSSLDDEKQLEKDGTAAVQAGSSSSTSTSTGSSGSGKVSGKPRRSRKAKKS